uniref:Uncharacterized protein n=1 Tax=Arsenophonus endosymbiont of Trialeurodes vaporariorum TaxID=235567 RepID=A0A3B0MFY8_9GAMM
MATIDLSLLPAPDVVEILDFEILLAERKNALINACPDEIKGIIKNTLALDYEPLIKLLQENVYRELLLRQRVNEAALASMVAFAQGSDLDQLAANNNVKRLILTSGDGSTIPPIPPVYESDSDLRVRIPAAFEGLSVAGPIGSYEYHAHSADGQVADASVISPKTAEVTVSILSRDGDGTARANLLEKVNKALNDEGVRPVADRVTVQAAKIINYTIDAVLYLYPAPEYEPILNAAQEKIEKYTTEQHRLGRHIVLSAIYAALHVPGVQRVALNAPKQDILLDKTQASFCTEIKINRRDDDEK